MGIVYVIKLVRFALIWNIGTLEYWVMGLRLGKPKAQRKIG
jgi:hypothetical protein